MAVIAFWIIVVILLRQSQSLYLTFIFVPFLLNANLLYHVNFVIGEPNLYISTLGYCMLIAKGIQHLSRLWPRLTKLIYVFVLCIYCLRSVQRSYDWRTEETVYKSGLEVCPNSAKMHYNYAKMLTDPRDGRPVSKDGPKNAQKHYEIALELWPTFTNALINLGTIYEKNGKYTKAENLYRKALDIEPDYAMIWMNLG